MLTAQVFDLATALTRTAYRPRTVDEVIVGLEACVNTASVLIGAALGAAISLVGAWFIQSSNIQVDTRKQRLVAYLDFYADASFGCRLANSFVENEESWKQLIASGLALRESIVECDSQMEALTQEYRERVDARAEDVELTPEELRLDEEFVTKGEESLAKIKGFDAAIAKNDGVQSELEKEIVVIEGKVNEFDTKMELSLFKMEMISPPLIL
jgi:hypothetical protein